MARKVEVLLLDDIDGSKAAETVRFALDGVTYEIDLSEKNANKLRGALAEFTAHARRAPKVSNVIPIKRAPRGEQPAKFVDNANQPARDKELNNQIREWARKHGCEVGDKGRISGQVVAAFKDDNPAGLPGYKAPEETTVESAKPVKAVKAAKAVKPVKAAFQSAVG